MLLVTEEILLRRVVTLGLLQGVLDSCLLDIKITTANIDNIEYFYIRTFLYQIRIALIYANTEFRKELSAHKIE